MLYAGLLTLMCYFYSGTSLTLLSLTSGESYTATVIVESLAEGIQQRSAPATLNFITGENLEIDLLENSDIRWHPFLIKINSYSCYI